jgi:hypothetical protein
MNTVLGYIFSQTHLVALLPRVQVKPRSRDEANLISVILLLTYQEDSPMFTF